MKVLVLAPGSADAAAIVRDLSLCGVDAFPQGWSESVRSAFPSEIERAVFVLPMLGVVDIGEQVEQVRELLGRSTPLLVACQQLTASDRRTILKCGASEIVSPRGWHPAEIAERVLAQLIVDGAVCPIRFGDLWGGTVTMQALYKQIDVVAPLAETVLILGETGTGKERVAHEIHRRSRRPGELMAVNSAEFSTELLGSELFGHERGAFSSADKKREGLLVAAGEGTFFLDEIGDLARDAQAKLLRVVEERKVRPVGGNRWEPVRARLILATRRNLEDSSDDEFRRDLYERLRGFTLKVPPLRERLADLPLLVRRFVDEYNREYGGDRKVPVQALDALFRYSWPGNVRELRLAIRQAAAYAAGAEAPISALHLLDAAHRRNGHLGAENGVKFDPTTETWRQVHDRIRTRYFRAVLKETGGNKDAAAQRAGVSRSQFYEILRGLEHNPDTE
ncbi:MAG: sigma 54-interacting transcriptional regulator [Acidobacteria bacterium]|nr:sigma 54-interacting transcriptional regulator [Acidobacteriota bacterium]